MGIRALILGKRGREPDHRALLLGLLVLLFADCHFVVMDGTDPGRTAPFADRNGPPATAPRFPWLRVMLQSYTRRTRNWKAAMFSSGAV